MDLLLTMIRWCDDMGYSIDNPDCYELNVLQSVTATSKRLKKLKEFFSFRILLVLYFNMTMLVVILSGMSKPSSHIIDNSSVLSCSFTRHVTSRTCIGYGQSSAGLLSFSNSRYQWIVSLYWWVNCGHGRQFPRKFLSTLEASDIVGFTK